MTPLDVDGRLRAAFTSMPIAGEPMESERLIADMEARTRELIRQSEQVRERIAETEVSVTSPEGAVTVRVAPSGALQGIEFTPRIAGMSHVRLGQVVMAAVRSAQAQVLKQVNEIVAPQFGDTEAMEFLNNFLPSTEPPPAAPREPARRRAPEPRDDDDAIGPIMR